MLKPGFMLLISFLKISLNILLILFLLTAFFAASLGIENPTLVFFASLPSILRIISLFSEKNFSPFAATSLISFFFDILWILVSIFFTRLAVFSLFAFFFLILDFLGLSAFFF